MRPEEPVKREVERDGEVGGGRDAVTLVALALAVLVTAAACGGSTPAPQARPRAPAPRPTYYVSLGDSLSQGVQPNAAGTSVPTPQGYPNQLYAALRRTHPGLRLVKFGCGGETTTTMINGGICSYPAGSQLATGTAPRSKSGTAPPTARPKRLSPLGPLAG